MTDRDFERACALVSRRYGLDMEAKRILLECRLAHERARLGMPSFSAYLDLLEAGCDSVAETRFADLVTTHYTYFMRESSQFAFLESHAFPELLQRRPGRTWSILCAGCSTGEECYTLSMLVEDYARFHRMPDVRITGIDLSQPAIEEARASTYPEARIDKVPAHWRSTYFARTPEGLFTVNPAIRRRVRFLRANFADEAALAATFDLIFCRNVIIYFHAAAKQRALDALHRHLADDGYLVLGHAEIIRDRDKFAYCGDSIYRKRAKAMHA